MPAPVIVLLYIVVIFGLIGGLIVVYHKVSRPSNLVKEGDKGFERENRLFVLYQNLEDMMDGFDGYIEETRASLEMEKIEFLREREELTRMHATVLALLNNMQDQQNAARANPVPVPPIVESIPEPSVPEIQYPLVQPSSARANSIWLLHCEGKSVERIARELGVSMNEVNLTLKLLLGGVA